MLPTDCTGDNIPYTLLTTIKRLRINRDKERKVWLSLVNTFSRTVVCFGQQHMIMVEYHRTHASSRRKWSLIVFWLFVFLFVCLFIFDKWSCFQRKHWSAYKQSKQESRRVINETRDDETEFLNVSRTCRSSFLAGVTAGRITANRKLTELYWLSRKRSPKRQVQLVEPKKWRDTKKIPSLSDPVCLQRHKFYRH